MSKLINVFVPWQSKGQALSDLSLSLPLFVCDKTVFNKHLILPDAKKTDVFPPPKKSNSSDKSEVLLIYAYKWQQIPSEFGP